METNLRSLVALVLLVPFLAGKFVLPVYYIPRMFTMSSFIVVVVVLVFFFYSFSLFIFTIHLFSGK